MSRRKTAPWRPDWAVHPGEILRELLAEKGLNGTVFAAQLGVSQPYVSEILNGHRTISARVALRLEKAFGGPTAEFWVGMQAQYDLTMERLREPVASSAPTPGTR